jgi:hypothetical protein
MKKNLALTRIMKSSAAYVMSKCGKSTPALGLPSRVLDFTQPTTEAEKALAHGLWAAYNINLPDTPRRVAITVSHILKEKGYQINGFNNKP